MELRATEEIQFKKGCDMYTSLAKYSGKVSVTNHRVYFKPSPMFIGKDPIEIPLEEIEEVKRVNYLFVIPNSIKIKTKEGRIYRFVLLSLNSSRIVDYLNETIFNEI